MNSISDILAAYVFIPLFGGVLAMVLSRVAIKVLPRLKMVDVPRGRHQHEHPVPRGGGVAIFLSFFAAVCFLWGSCIFKGSVWTGELCSFMRYFSLPALIILIVGLLDDRFELRSLVKLFFQVLVGLIFYFEGCGISLLFGDELPPLLSLIFTIIWCVTIINAFNLVDGLDGVASGLGMISSFLLAAWSLINGCNNALVVILLCFGMSNLGFLRYNFSPAKIFMGDTGSMFIGLFFAYVSMQYSTKAVTFAALLVPLTAVGVPVFDVFLAVWRRGVRKYISKNEDSAIMQGDHDHLHHRILKENGRTGKTALIIYGLAIMLSLLAMVNEFVNSSFPTLAFVVLLITLSAMIRYANIELYDTITSVIRGVDVSRKNFLFTAIHPGLDTLLVFLALFFSSKVYGVLLPFPCSSWWYLLFLLPFLLILCFSGIYRTFWLRAGILQYYKLARLLIISGIAGYILNLVLWHYGMDLSRSKMLSASSFYLIFWGFATSFILIERFVLHYYESFGYRRLFIRNQGMNDELSRVLIYGGGLLCRLYISSVYCSGVKWHRAVKIVGIMDDNPALKNLNVYGFKVYGSCNELEYIYAILKFDSIVVASRDINGEKLENIKKFCAEKHIDLKEFVCTEKKL